MASLQRSVRRLGVRRQRHILGKDDTLLATHRFLGDARGTAVGTFVVVVLIVMCTDFLIASWREAPMLLGLFELAGIAGVAALGAVAMRRLGQRALTSVVEQPRQLAAALEHELQVADQRRAEIERLDVAAMRAFWVHAQGRPPRLLLDCAHDGWVLLAPPSRADNAPLQVKQAWSIERLRWTHAIVSMTTHGHALPAPQLDVPAEAFDGLDPCEVRTRTELPVAIQGALPQTSVAYRS